MPEICLPGEITLWLSTGYPGKQTERHIKIIHFSLFIIHYSLKRKNGAGKGTQMKTEFADVMGVVDIVKQRVKEQTGVTLECDMLIMM